MQSRSQERDLTDGLFSAVRMVQFLAVGGFGAICDMGVLALAHDLGGVDLWLAKLLSAETAIVVMFVINENWTFADEGLPSVRALARRFATSNVVRIGGVGVSTAVLLALTGYADVWYLAANAVGILVGFVVNYVMESLLTWRVHHGPGV